MKNRNFFLLIDTETTIEDTVADFGAIICDRKGNIVKQCGILTKGIFNVIPLFYKRSDDSDSIWSEQGRDRRIKVYNDMLDRGDRIIASPTAINRWLVKARLEYNPIITAYNLAFDWGKCANTLIDLTIFEKKFCLWHAAYNRWSQTRKYLQFILDIHAFNIPTALRNMSYKTDAETMARFILNQPGMADEPHTALEDAIGYELPILREVVKNQSIKQLTSYTEGFNWRNVQVNEHFQPKV